MKLVLTILKTINRFVRKVFYILGHVKDVRMMISDPDICQTYYGDSELKSRFRIYLDNLRWLVRFREINTFFYLYGFDRKSGVDMDGYIANVPFKELRNRQNQLVGIGKYYSSYTCMLKDKFVFSRMLTSLGYPTPKVMALVNGNSVHWLESGKIEHIESLRDIEGLDVFCKTILGECADGVFPLTNRGGSLYIEDREVTVTELLEIVRGIFIIQERIEQHPKMAELYPHAINTQRIITINAGGRIIPFAALQKAGAQGNTRDNWAIGGVLGGIDMKTGRLAKKFFFKPGYGGAVREHPETGVVFGDFDVPHFPEAVSLVTGLHSFFYGIHSIGWDTAITKDGPTIIEGNDNWEISCHQAIDGGLKRKFQATIERC